MLSKELQPGTRFTPRQCEQPELVDWPLVRYALRLNPNRNKFEEFKKQKR